MVVVTEELEVEELAYSPMLMSLQNKPSFLFLLSLNFNTLSSGTLALPNKGMLKVNLLEAVLSVVINSKGEVFERDVRL